VAAALSAGGDAVQAGGVIEWRGPMGCEHKAAAT
jgi:hypothetical protein